jgi:pimeloyl-ACP methyl ester carboxylesterase
MSDIAGHLVGAIEHDIGQPVFLQGTSTGGSVVLQLAVDRPELVRRLVVVSAAYRLGPAGRAQQAEMARLIRAGQPREAWASAITAVLPPAGRMTPADATDMLVTLEAEDAFDVEASLPRVTAPTLVIGGGRDDFYSEEQFRGTAAGVQDGRVHIFPDWGHVRASSSPATTNLALGFMFAGINLRTEL